MLSLDELRQEVEAGTIDTIVTAFTDMQGRLFGKRIVGEYFLDEVVQHVERQCADLGDRPRAVGAVRGVADVDDRLVRQLVEDGASHRQASDPAVEDADRRVHVGNLSGRNTEGAERSRAPPLRSYSLCGRHGAEK